MRPFKETAEKSRPRALRSPAQRFELESKEVINDSERVERPSL